MGRHLDVDLVDAVDLVDGVGFSMRLGKWAFAIGYLLFAMRCAVGAALGVA